MPYQAHTLANDKIKVIFSYPKYKKTLCLRTRKRSLHRALPRIRKEKLAQPPQTVSTSKAAPFNAALADPKSELQLMFLDTFDEAKLCLFLYANLFLILGSQCITIAKIPVLKH